MSDSEPIPWGDLSDGDRENFTAMLNQRFGADLTVSDAAEYYGDREKVERELGDITDDDGPACSNCFNTITRYDLPELQATGECPHCGAVITS